MKFFFTFFSSVLVTGQLLAQVAPINNCFAAFQMGYGNQLPISCQSFAANKHSPASLQLLGRRMADGFTWHDSPATVGGSTIRLYGHHGSTTKPAGTAFRDCPGVWTYFKLRGISVNSRHRAAEEITQYARIRHYGNEANPDSVRVEFDGLNRQPYASFEKRVHCEDCLVERISPTISCPTQTVRFPLTEPKTLYGEIVAKQAGILNLYSFYRKRE